MISDRLILCESKSGLWAAEAAADGREKRQIYHNDDDDDGGETMRETDARRLMRGKSQIERYDWNAINCD